MSLIFSAYLFNYFILFVNMHSPTQLIPREALGAWKLF